MIIQYTIYLCLVVEKSAGQLTHQIVSNMTCQKNCIEYVINEIFIELKKVEEEMTVPLI